MGASWGAFMAVLATDDLLQLGRWEELDSLLDATGTSNAGRAGAVVWPLVAGQLAMARGQLEPACELLERARESALRGATPELLPHVGTALAELRLWQGMPPAARRHVEEACRLIGDHEDVLNTPPLLDAGVRVEAEIAARAVPRRRPARGPSARERAEALARRLDALAGSGAPAAEGAGAPRAGAGRAGGTRPARRAARRWAAAARRGRAGGSAPRRVCALRAMRRRCSPRVASVRRRGRAAAARAPGRRDLGARAPVPGRSRRSRAAPASPMSRSPPLAAEPEDALASRRREAEVLGLWPTA